MLGTVGRGGNAQAVRDEILHIMHRNHIGEKRGTWMEVSNQSLLPFELVPDATLKIRLQSLEAWATFG